MTGVMQGHFDTVLLAYGLTTGVLIVYLAVVIHRIRTELRERGSATFGPDQK